MGDEGVLGSDVDGVVDLPVDVSDLPGWMEEALGASCTNTRRVNYTVISHTDFSNIPASGKLSGNLFKMSSVTNKLVH